MIALDEFQQIGEYPEQGVEALLRSHIQLLPFVRFVFAGSRKHMMEEMFVSPRRPFYQSTQILSLREIPCTSYAAFAKGFFDGASLPFDAELFSEVYRRFGGITWYVQATLNRIWEAGGGLSDVAQIDAAIDSLVEDQALVFHDLLRSQSEGSQTMLRAIARAGAESKLTVSSGLSPWYFLMKSANHFSVKPSPRTRRMRGRTTGGTARVRRCPIRTSGARAAAGGAARPIPCPL